MNIRPIKKPRVQPQRKQRLRVLLAEDDPAAQLIVRTLLEKHGYLMVSTGNGFEALARFQAEPFDLVLTDVHMPEMDGLALTDALRRLEANTGVHVPIIGVSANAKPGDREHWLAAGMDGFVPKPILPKAMLAEIERVLGNRAARATGTET